MKFKLSSIFCFVLLSSLVLLISCELNRSKRQPAKAVQKSKGKGVGVDPEHQHPGKGKEAVHGTIKHAGKKANKRPKHANQKTYVWRGKVVNMRAPSADDSPPTYIIPNADAVQHGRSCKEKSAKVSMTGKGPAADGTLQDHFKPCLDRGRGGEKRGKWTNEEFREAQAYYYPERPKKDNAHHQANSETFNDRRKRSETYSSANLLWQNPENIPIMFDRSYPEQYRANVRKAYSFWQNNTCLKFIEKPTGTVINTPHILMTNTGRGQCSTDRLGPNTSPPWSTVIETTLCYNLTGSIAHEIGHALGLAHSQKRVDRDGAVSVNMANIPSSWRSQFDKDSDRLFDEWGVPYFFNSIMHYSPYAASANGLMTICPLDPIMEAVMGQREEPAFGDISLINRIYCQESCFYKNELPTVPFNGNLTLTVSGRTCQNWGSQTPQKHRFTNLGNHDSCRNPDNWAGGPWCYTKDPAVPYEPCFSSCEDLEKAKRPYCHGWCYNGGFHSASNCECVCPRYANGRFCENLDMSTKHAHVTCGGQVDLKPGVSHGISTPNWPHNYTSDALCLWWIRAPEKMRVKATITDFFVEIPDSSGCYDYVEIRKSICAPAKTNPDEMRYCGNSLAPSPTPKMITSDDSNMVIKFLSDERHEARGFSIIVEAV